MSNMAVEVRPEHITSSSSSPHSHHHSFPGHLPTGGGGHNSSFLSGFGPPGGKNLMDTSDLNLGGSPQENLPSLYEFLVGIFGESLVVRLSGHLRNLSEEKRLSVVKCEGVSSVREMAVGGEQLLGFLKREGFQQIRVQLPLKPLPCKPPAYHPWGRQLWRFQIPTSVLPVQGNPLERRPRKRGVNIAAMATGRWCCRRWSGGRTSRGTCALIDLGGVWL